MKLYVTARVPAVQQLVNRLPRQLSTDPAKRKLSTLFPIAFVIVIAIVVVVVVIIVGCKQVTKYFRRRHTTAPHPLLPHYKNSTLSKVTSLSANTRTNWADPNQPDPGKLIYLVSVSFSSACRRAPKKGQSVEACWFTVWFSPGLCPFFIYLPLQGTLLHQCSLGVPDRGQCRLDEPAAKPLGRNAVQEPDVVLSRGNLF